METVAARLDELYAIGGGVGANRPGLGEGEELAHELTEAWMVAEGLETSRDAAGNLYGRRRGSRPELSEIWVGSHLDSVPSGGRFDGALGVVAALSAVASQTTQPLRTLAVVALRDEEGSRFGRGLFGSRAVSGQLPADGLSLRDADGISVREALAAQGRSLDGRPGWLVSPPAAFIELHVEQGPVLARHGAVMGIVESIVGLLELEVRLIGREGHAGTTPMDARRDAALCAASFHVEAARAAALIPGAVATIGRHRLEPGVANVIPRLVELTVDVRAPDAARLEALESAIREAAETAARTHGCELDLRVSSRTPPVATDAGLRRVLGRAAPTATLLPSGAVHDAQVFALAGIPIGLLFVRSLADGISHSPAESTAFEDVAEALGALAGALRELAADPADPGPA